MAQLEQWLRSYRPEELFDEQGVLRPEIAGAGTDRAARMSANPHANGGLLLRDLDLPEFPDYAVAVDKPAAETAEATRVLGTFLRDVIARNPDRFRIDGARRNRVEPARGRCSSRPTRRGWPRSRPERRAPRPAKAA